VFQGPGSFTGLRIGITVANAIAYAQSVPIVGTRGEHWMADGIKRLQSGQNDTRVMPYYGADPNITKPGKQT
jgi:tRNA threonylcarbamoyladenosine biosynthesis protein TsaB